MRVTRSAILERIHALGYEGVDLWNAGTYWVFTGGIADYFTEQGVTAFRLGDMSVDHWVRIFLDRARAVDHPEAPSPTGPKVISLRSKL